MLRVSFVIPSYDNFQLVNQLLVDTNEHTLPDEIIVVDDCSTDKTAIEGLEWWARNMSVKVRRTPENLGFLRASNWGMKQATGDIICLISTDVRVEDDVVNQLKYILSEDGRERPRVLCGGVVYRESTGWNEFDGKVFPYVEGWFLACHKDAWEEFGYFDERFAPHDFEDVDLSTTALSKGYELLPLSSLRHLGAQSIGYGEERTELTKTNQEKFREKWITQSSENA